MMNKTAVIMLSLALIAILYLSLWPISVQPHQWHPPEAPSLESGPYVANTDLAKAQRFPSQLGAGPEDIALDSAGRIYAGLLNGIIARYDPQGKNPEEFANTQGRPLGLHFDSLGNLIVADADAGLLSVNPAGEIQTLSTTADGTAFAFTDDVDIAADGKIYFSDASHKFSVHNYKDDLLEHGPYGRLLVYDPSSGQTSVLLDSLYFANGVAVSEDQSFVLIVETSAYRIQKYWLKGPKSGTSEIFVENLPGFPDGVSQGSGGVFWVALANPRNTVLDKLLPHPFLRKVVKRLPEGVQPSPVNYGFVLGFDREGELLYNLQDGSEGCFAPVTSVQEAGEWLYLGSLSAPEFARYPNPQYSND